MGQLRLYWRPGAASLAPHMALAEVGVPYELVRLEREEAQTDPGYRALNPLGVVPTLVDGDRVQTESAAILLYLADRFPDAHLAPADRADFYRWLVFMTNTVQTTMLRVFYPERYGGPEVEPLARAEAAGHFAILDAALDGRDWLVDDHRTGADLFLFMLTRWARRLDPPAWDVLPALRAHFARTLALAGVRRAMEEEELELPDWAVA